MSVFNLRTASNVLHQSGVSDAVLLKTLHTLSTSELNDLHENVQGRIATNNKIKALAEEGNVAVVESGRDADCVQYSGVVHTVSSNLPEFWKFIDRMYYNAEGPISWYVARLSEADNVEYTSRDLAMEAFEDGHPHVVYC